MCRCRRNTCGSVSCYFEYEHVDLNAYVAVVVVVVVFAVLSVAAELARRVDAAVFEDEGATFFFFLVDSNTYFAMNPQRSNICDRMKKMNTDMMAPRVFDRRVRSTISMPA